MSVPNGNADPVAIPSRSRPGFTVIGAVERLIAIAMALVLLRSAFAHLGNPYYFLSTVYSYELTGIQAGKWIALILPFVQMTVAVCLLARWWAPAAYALGFLLFWMFLSAQLLIVGRGLQIDCGCFGASQTLIVGRTTILEAGTFAALSMFGWVSTVLLTRVSR
jgi:hypothetical protein